MPERQVQALALNPFERMPRHLAAIALLAMALHAGGAIAGHADEPIFSVSGFGTAGLAHSNEENADFISGGIRPKGVGHTRAWSADVDSRIGAQISGHFTPEFSAVLQVIAEHRYDNTYTPTVEWANIKYQVTPDFSLRAGRIVLPVFLVSDSRKVGFANPWVRPPVEVYTMVPISDSDGVDLSYRAHAGDLTNTVQGIYGSTEPKLPPGQGTAKAKDVWGIAYTGEYGAATVHITYHEARVTLDAYKPLFDAFRQFGAEGNALADKYDTDNKPFTFIGLGAMYDPGGWFVMGEWGATDGHSVLGQRTAWYASGGYRFGDFTPYLTYAQAKAVSDTSDPGLTLAALPPFLVVPAAGLNANLNAALRAMPIQRTLSVGGRWDFAEGAAFKLQFDQTRLGAGSSGTLINIQPGFQPGGRFNVFSATIDFVF